MVNKNLTVGEDVVQWAEKYWLIDKILKGELDMSKGEAFSYDYFRKVFIKAIDGNIAERLAPEPQPEQEGIHSL